MKAKISFYEFQNMMHGTKITSVRTGKTVCRWELYWTYWKQPEVLLSLRKNPNYVVEDKTQADYAYWDRMMTMKSLYEKNKQKNVSLN